LAGVEAELAEQPDLFREEGGAGSRGARRPSGR
jgi:hypothetical protein